jgi:hypothetical protein
VGLLKEVYQEWAVITEPSRTCNLFRFRSWPLLSGEKGISDFSLWQFEEPFMKLKLVAAISALAIPALAHAEQSGPQPTVPKPTKADAQKGDKMKTQVYCDLTKLEGQVKAVQQTTDTKTVEMLTKQAEALIDKLGPEYFKLMDGLEQVDPKSSEAKEFMSILSELDKRCTKAFRGGAGTALGSEIAHAR